MLCKISLRPLWWDLGLQFPIECFDMHHRLPALKHLHHRTTTMTTNCKREVLKDSSKLFNPLGITSPVSVHAKLFMQKLWHLHVDWDEPLDAVVKEE